MAIDDFSFFIIHSSSFHSTSSFEPSPATSDRNPISVTVPIISFSLNPLSPIYKAYFHLSIHPLNLHFIIHLFAFIAVFKLPRSKEILLLEFITSLYFYFSLLLNYRCRFHSNLLIMVSYLNENEKYSVIFDSIF